MICLAIAGQDSSTASQATLQSFSLRETALWYPSVPDPDLCLNDGSFTGENPFDSGYQPLCWVHFGGHKGVDLRSLTEVCVTRLGALCSIEFLYDIKTTRKETQKLGRRISTMFSDVIRFPIDGPGGEFIESVEVSLIRVISDDVYSFYRHGKLESFKVGIYAPCDALLYLVTFINDASSYRFRRIVGDLSIFKPEKVRWMHLP